MPDTLTIAARFAGPPGCGNGGYAAGRLAAGLGPAAEVTLRRPVPLDAALSLDRVNGQVELADGDGLIAQARAAEPDLTPIQPLGPAAARAAGERAIPLSDHPYPACFGCGPARAEGDGLRLFTGPVEGSDRIAGLWQPDRHFADADGVVDPAFVWTALDCPSGFALSSAAGRPLVLGRMTARQERAVRVGEDYVVVAWPIGSEGRKLFAGSAVFDRDGGLCAIAHTIWFEAVASA